MRHTRGGGRKALFQKDFLPPPLGPHLPPSQDFRLMGRRRAGNPFRLGFEKIPLHRAKKGYPRNLHYPIKRLLRRLAAGANAPPGQGAARPCQRGSHLTECGGSASVGAPEAEPLGLRGMGFGYRGRRGGSGTKTAACDSDGTLFRGGVASEADPEAIVD